MGPSSSLCRKEASILNLSVETHAQIHPTRISRSSGFPLGIVLFASWEFLAHQNFIYHTFFFPQREFGYTKDEKVQVDKSNYLNTYGARLTGLEAQIKMQRSM